METLITTENDFKEYQGDLPTDVVYFKIVNVGPETLLKENVDIHNLVTEQAGFYALGNDIRSTMHDLVDRFCNAREK